MTEQQLSCSHAQLGQLVCSCRHSRAIHACIATVAAESSDRPPRFTYAGLFAKPKSNGRTPRRWLATQGGHALQVGSLRRRAVLFSTTSKLLVVLRFPDALVLLKVADSWGA